MLDDIKGTKLKEIINEKQAAGKHIFTTPTNTIAKGLYMAVIYIDGNIEFSEKIIINPTQ